MTTDTRAAAGLHVVVRLARRTDSVAATDDVHPVAMIDCDELDIHDAVLVFEPRANRLRLQSPCGCSASVELSRMLLGLAELHRGDGNPHAQVH